MNVIVLAAGSDDAFQSAQQPRLYPKNLVEVGGEPLVQFAIRAWSTIEIKRLIVCVKASELERHHTGDVVRLIEPRADVLPVPAETGGALCTALLAMDSIDLSEPVVIVNGDIVLDTDLASVLRHFEPHDGGIVTFDAVHPRWSFVRVDRDGFVLEAAEKRPISRNATAGLYYFARASDFLAFGSQHMLKAGDPNRNFFVCPIYNEAVLEGRRIATYNIPRNSYHSLADPHGVAMFEASIATEGPSA